MSPLIPLTVDLDRPWGPEEAGEVLDHIPVSVVFELFRVSHHAMHVAFQEARSRDRRRPWRWHRLRRLKRREAAYCSEFARRLRLIDQIIVARAELE